MRFATKQERQIENKKMRKGLMTFLLMLTTAVSAFGQAEIKFAELTHNFGTFSEDNATQKTTFTFTNVGDAPLIINQATASLRLHRSGIYQEAHSAGQDGNNNSNIQRQIQISGAFQEDHYRKNQRQGGNDTPVYRRKHA